MGHRLWLPAVAIHRQGVVEIAPSPHHCFPISLPCAQSVKEALYRMWCGANRLGDSDVHTLGDNSAFVNRAGQLLLPGGVRPEWIPSA